MINPASSEALKSLDFVYLESIRINDLDQVSHSLREIMEDPTIELELDIKFDNDTLTLTSPYKNLAIVYADADFSENLHNITHRINLIINAPLVQINSNQFLNTLVVNANTLKLSKACDLQFTVEGSSFNIAKILSTHKATFTKLNISLDRAASWVSQGELEVDNCTISLDSAKAFFKQKCLFKNEHGNSLLKLTHSQITFHQKTALACDINSINSKISCKQPLYLPRNYTTAGHSLTLVADEVDFCNTVRIEKSLSIFADYRTFIKEDADISCEYFECDGNWLTIAGLLDAKTQSTITTLVTTMLVGASFYGANKRINSFFYVNALGLQFSYTLDINSLAPLNLGLHLPQMPNSIRDVAGPVKIGKLASYMIKFVNMPVGVAIDLITKIWAFYMLASYTLSILLSAKNDPERAKNFRLRHAIAPIVMSKSLYLSASDLLYSFMNSTAEFNGVVPADSDKTYFDYLLNAAQSVATLETQNSIFSFNGITLAGNINRENFFDFSYADVGFSKSIRTYSGSRYNDLVWSENIIATHSYSTYGTAYANQSFIMTDNLWSSKDSYIHVSQGAYHVGNDLTLLGEVNLNAQIVRVNQNLNLGVDSQLNVANSIIQAGQVLQESGSVLNMDLASNLYTENHQVNGTAIFSRNSKAEVERELLIGTNGTLDAKQATYNVNGNAFVQGHANFTDSLFEVKQTLELAKSGKLYADNHPVKAHDISNSGLIDIPMNSLIATDEIHNHKDGRIAGRSSSITARSFINDGIVSLPEELRVLAKYIKNSGSVYAHNVFLTGDKELINEGTMNGYDISLEGNSVLIRSGHIQAASSLKITFIHMHSSPGTTIAAKYLYTNGVLQTGAMSGIFYMQYTDNVVFNLDFGVPLAIIMPDSKSDFINTYKIISTAATAAEYVYMPIAIGIRLCQKVYLVASQTPILMQELVGLYQGGHKNFRVRNLINPLFTAKTTVQNLQSMLGDVKELHAFEYKQELNRKKELIALNIDNFSKMAEKFRSRNLAPVYLAIQELGINHVMPKFYAATVSSIPILSRVVAYLPNLWPSMRISNGLLRANFVAEFAVNTNEDVKYKYNFGLFLAIGQSSVVGTFFHNYGFSRFGKLSANVCVMLNNGIFKVGSGNIKADSFVTTKDSKTTFSDSSIIVEQIEMGGKWKTKNVEIRTNKAVLQFLNHAYEGFFALFAKQYNEEEKVSFKALDKDAYYQLEADKGIPTAQHDAANFHCKLPSLDKKQAQDFIEHKGDFKNINTTGECGLETTHHVEVNNQCRERLRVIAPTANIVEVLNKVSVYIKTTQENSDFVLDNNINMSGKFTLDVNGSIHFTHNVVNVDEMEIKANGSYNIVDSITRVLKEAIIQGKVVNVVATENGVSESLLHAHTLFIKVTEGDLHTNARITADLFASLDVKGNVVLKRRVFIDSKGVHIEPAVINGGNGLTAEHPLAYYNENLVGVALIMNCTKLINDASGINSIGSNFVFVKEGAFFNGHHVTTQGEWTDKEKGSFDYCATQHRSTKTVTQAASLTSAEGENQVIVTEKADGEIAFKGSTLDAPKGTKLDAKGAINGKEYLYVDVTEVKSTKGWGVFKSKKSYSEMHEIISVLKTGSGTIFIKSGSKIDITGTEFISTDNGTLFFSAPLYIGIKPSTLTNRYQERTFSMSVHSVAYSAAMDIIQGIKNKNYAGLTNLTANAKDAIKAKNGVEKVANAWNAAVYGQQAKDLYAKFKAGQLGSHLLEKAAEVGITYKRVDIVRTQETEGAGIIMGFAYLIVETKGVFDLGVHVLVCHANITAKIFNINAFRATTSYEQRERSATANVNLISGEVSGGVGVSHQSQAGVTFQNRVFYVNSVTFDVVTFNANGVDFNADTSNGRMEQMNVYQPVSSFESRSSSFSADTSGNVSASRDSTSSTLINNASNIHFEQNNAKIDAVHTEGPATFTVGEERNAVEPTTNTPIETRSTQKGFSVSVNVAQVAKEAFGAPESREVLAVAASMGVKKANTTTMHDQHGSHVISEQSTNLKVVAPLFANASPVENYAPVIPLPPKPTAPQHNGSQGQWNDGGAGDNLQGAARAGENQYIDLGASNRRTQPVVSMPSFEAARTNYSNNQAQHQERSGVSKSEQQFNQRPQLINDRGESHLIKQGADHSQVDNKVHDSVSRTNTGYNYGQEVTFLDDMLVKRDFILQLEDDTKQKFTFEQKRDINNQIRVKYDSSSENPSLIVYAVNGKITVGNRNLYRSGSVGSTLRFGFVDAIDPDTFAQRGVRVGNERSGLQDVVDSAIKFVGSKAVNIAGKATLGLSLLFHPSDTGELDDHDLKIAHTSPIDWKPVYEVPKLPTKLIYPSADRNIGGNGRHETPIVQGLGNQLLPGAGLDGNTVDSRPLITPLYDGDKGQLLLKNISRFDCDNGLVYENAPYHGRKDNSVKNRAPTDPKSSLENSKIYKAKGNNQRRLAYDSNNQEIVVLDGNIETTFHGHVRDWSELDNAQKAFMQKEFNFSKKGKIKKTLE